MTARYERPPFRSGYAGIAWPPVNGGALASLASLVEELEHSQWLTAAELSGRQFEQLAVLARYCAEHSKYFAQRLKDAGLSPSDLAHADGLAQLPVMTRRALQTAGADLYCSSIPPGHEPVAETRTSGSTGEPVMVRRTAMNALFWSATAIREHFWHGRDFSKRLCSLRANVRSINTRKDWGQPVSLLYETGEAKVLPIDEDTAFLFQQVAEFAPDNLLIYPSTLGAIAQHSRQIGAALPSLRHIRTIGEMLSPHIRTEAAAQFGASIEDLYSSNEIGYIATQCPESGLYHVMSEDVIVEVLDDKGAACTVGETGRVILTSLHNLATPLIRYDIGDYAEVGGVCSCGRGLPTLKRIVGRERNLILMPDGSRYWPLGGLLNSRDFVPLSQWQMIQTARETIEVRLVTERPLTSSEEEKLRSLMLKSLRHPFSLDFRYYEGRLPLGPNGKFEEFICRVAS